MFFLNKQNILVRFYFPCVVCVMWHVTRGFQQKKNMELKSCEFCELAMCVCVLFVLEACRVLEGPRL